MKFHADWLPEDMQRFRAIEKTFRQVCLAHGYGEIRTPVIEKLHWFTGAGILSPDLMHKVYTFLDWDGWSGERVVLRPDNTVPVCRLFSQHYMGNKKARLFYIDDVFRYKESEKTGGRLSQAGVEMLGNFSSPIVRDVEIIVLILDFLEDLNIGKPEIILSHAGILHAYLKSLDLSDEEEAEAFDLIMEGHTDDLTRKFSGKSNLSGLNRLLELRGASPSFLTNLKALGKDSPGFVEAVEELEKITSHLDSFGIKYEVNPALHKDLTYYTGLMYDIILEDAEIGGGGRYDNLLEKFTGEKIGGSGFSIYISPLMELMKKQEKAEVIPRKITLITDFSDMESVDETLKTARVLRKKGCVISVTPKDEDSEELELWGNIHRSQNGFEIKAGKGESLHDFPLTGENLDEILAFWEVQQ